MAKKAAKKDTKIHPAAIPGTPSGEPPAGTHGAVADSAEQQGMSVPQRSSEPVNVIVDSRGTQFDPNVHAAHADGVTPHVDSFGHFIQKAHHYDGAKKSHYSDTHRHA